MPNTTGKTFDIDEWTVEVYQDDNNRIRMVHTPTGETGKWFSKIRHTNDQGYIDVPDFAIPKEYYR